MVLIKQKEGEILFDALDKGERIILHVDFDVVNSKFLTFLDEIRWRLRCQNLGFSSLGIKLPILVQILQIQRILQRAIHPPIRVQNRPKREVRVLQREGNKRELHFRRQILHPTRSQ